MTEREFECIRALVNLARIAGDRTTKAALRQRMLAAGWTDGEIKGAIATLKQKDQGST